MGDLEQCSLRLGNVQGADNWQTVFNPVVKRYRWAGLWRRFDGQGWHVVHILKGSTTSAGGDIQDLGGMISNRNTP